MTATAVRNDAPSPYDAHARIWDRFTAVTTDYDDYHHQLATLWKWHGHGGHDVLDIATGTGSIALGFARRGYRVTGCDISAAMISVAQDKAGSRGPRFLTADMRDVGILNGPFDLITCIGTAINYLATPEGVLAALCAARQVLATGGVYLFEMNTLHTYNTDFSSNAVIDGGDVVFIWRGLENSSVPSGGVARAQLDAFTSEGDGLWRRSIARHVHYHYPPGIMRELIRQAGLHLCGEYGNNSHEPAIFDGADPASCGPARDDHTDQKIMYVCRRIDS